MPYSPTAELTAQQLKHTLDRRKAVKKIAQAADRPLVKITSKRAREPGHHMFCCSLSGNEDKNPSNTHKQRAIQSDQH